MKKYLSLLFFGMTIIQMVLTAKCFAAPIHDAAKKGDVLTVLRLIADKSGNRDLISITSGKSREYRTPLHLAAENGQTEVVLALLDAGAPIDSNIETFYMPYRQEVLPVKTSHNTYSNDTALSLAAECGHADTVRLLLDRKAGIDNLSFYKALKNGHLEIVRTFFDRGFRPTGELYWLYFAASNGYTELVHELIARGVSVDNNHDSDDLETALYYAAKGGHSQIVKALISAGAKLSEKGRRYHGKFSDWALSPEIRAAFKPAALAQLHLEAAAKHLAEGHRELAARSYAWAAESIRPKNRELADKYLAMAGDGNFYKAAVRQPSHAIRPNVVTGQMSGLRRRHTGTEIGGASSSQLDDEEVGLLAGESE